MVSIHAPTRGATGIERYTRACLSVSIHAPTRGATSRTRGSCGIKSCFNPRTHTGCDQGGGKPYRVSRVSIHAPTRGATCIRGIDCTSRVFQSTHPHGVRPFSSQNPLRPLLFQSTHPHGVRRIAPCRLYQSRHVSIHAPTRGATAVQRGGKGHGRFQSTHPHGVRLDITNMAFQEYTMFQSTHPHGVRRTYVKSSFLADRFQSTHPHGVRQQFQLRFFPMKKVSIHAPTRGATGPYVYRGRAGVVSIHAPTRGATLPRNPFQ